MRASGIVKGDLERMTLSFSSFAVLALIGGRAWCHLHIHYDFLN
jgi:hypothetical protein